MSYGYGETAKLRDQLAVRDRQLSHARNETALARAERDKLKRRVKGGACPCCKRSFVALARHMKNQHPEYGK